MKSLTEKLMSESITQKLSKDDLLGIMCAVKCLQDNNCNFTLELKTKKIKPSLSEKEMFEYADILINQKIWEIV